MKTMALDESYPKVLYDVVPYVSAFTWFLYLLCVLHKLIAKYGEMNV